MDRHSQQRQAKASAAAANVQPILSVPPQPAAPGAAAAPATGSTWLRVDVPTASANPWDDAYGLAVPGQGFAAAALNDVEVIEPDIEQSWLPLPQPPEGPGVAAAADRCSFLDQDRSGGKAAGPSLAWNLDDAFSELRRARDLFGGELADKLGRIVIAHLDTGYDAGHVSQPVNLDLARQRNFVDAATPKDARDRTPAGMEALRNRGHGTATLALLAGNKLDGTSPSWPGFVDALGGAPLARVIPIRIADWVVRFSTSTMVQGFDHARQSGAHVLSMSMGGLTSEALVDAINLAYDAGVVIVTAAGNNFATTPMPKSIVFPARYRRVLAACGVMADGRAYAGLHSLTMQGSYGPASKMATALGAYTPNVPWAVIDCGKVVGMDGAGTSSATPQIAAAAALWLAEHRAVVDAYPQAWMRVEAVRQALFTSAAKSTGAMGTAETFEKIGQGVLKAAAALAVQPAAAANLRKLPPAEASWGWLDLVFGGGVSVAPGVNRGRAAMFALELTQMAQRVATVDEAIGDNDLPADKISAAARHRYLEAALDAGNPSKPLKAMLERARAAPKWPRRVRRRRRAGSDARPRCCRRPSGACGSTRSIRRWPCRSNSVDINQTTLSVPWEENLKPGPVGEYLEVVDVDPASGKFYDPVDLNEPKLLAQDGWPPSEGNPAFHQQMVYAVAMNTIGHFEEALGRSALWAPRRLTEIAEDGKTKYKPQEEVRRLRIYPHALRAENAYYSPNKVALLFGYFRAATQPGDVTAAGSMVFSCLSSDIIAHEMSHALLDGLHRRLQEASNPDVPAFHEAFADIVALFQHFTIPELVRFQIAQTGGKLTAARLLGGLARQFGEGTRHGGPLRDYLSGKKLPYATTMEVHARGSILVSAVYEAFLKIVDRRTADLIRIATNGTGMLPAGALHPDLVNRLTDEACKAAKHVLRMCIRALDYCPTVDITFGEYLRALITSDLDLVPNDRHRYRVAFMEAFRAHDLLPGGIKTVSEETLAWGTAEEPRPPWLNKVLDKVDFGWDRFVDRSAAFRLNDANRWIVRRGLEAAFATDPDLCTEFGLVGGVPKYDPQGNIERPAAPGETTFDVFSVRPARRVAPDGSFRTEVVATIQQRQRLPIDPAHPEGSSFWFRGGTTLILDPREGHREIRYSIVKSGASASRLARQRRTIGRGSMSALRGLYFGEVARRALRLAACPDRRARGRLRSMAKPSTKAGGRIVVRHYCQGIGDCHLLRYDKADGTPFWMLIDCGIHSSVEGGSDKMAQIVADIAGQTKNRLDVIVITHEHVDHLSGFLESAGRFAEFTVGEVWMAWTENPADTQASELDKYKVQALSALQLTSQRLDGAVGLDANLSGLRTGLGLVARLQLRIEGRTRACDARRRRKACTGSLLRAEQATDLSAERARRAHLCPRPVA